MSNQEASTGWARGTTYPSTACDQSCQSTVYLCMCISHTEREGECAYGRVDLCVYHRERECVCDVYLTLLVSVSRNRADRMPSLTRESASSTAAIAARPAASTASLTHRERRETHTHKINKGIKVKYRWDKNKYRRPPPLPPAPQLDPPTPRLSLRPWMPRGPLCVCLCSMVWRFSDGLMHV